MMRIHFKKGLTELIKILALQKKKRYNTMESDEKRVVISILFDREIRFGGTY